MITPDAFRNAVIDRAGKSGRDACAIMAAAIQAVDPARCVQDHLQSDSEAFSLSGQEILHSDVDRVFLIGFGKASVPMAKAVVDIVGDQLESATVITKDPKFLSANGYLGRLHVLLGGHPIPSVESVRATTTLLSSLPALTPRDLALVVISGGGSALFTAPVPGVSLEDLQALTNLLLRSGASIDEINTLRKHLDRVKGGRLAGLLAPARIHTLILSDVIGDRLDMIASGPTAPDPTTFEDAWAVLMRYGLLAEVAPSILQVLERGKQGKVPETLKSADFVGLEVHNHLVGTNLRAATAARDTALGLGYHSQIMTTELTGLTEDVAEFLAAILYAESTQGKPLAAPYCLVLGGETTVKVTGKGLGGRNQDLALRLTQAMVDFPNALAISLATDGEDGPTDAAGAATDSLVLTQGQARGLVIEKYIDNNDSYHYFAALDGLIKIGATGTNVNDLILLMGNETKKDGP